MIWNLFCHLFGFSSNWYNCKCQHIHVLCICRTYLAVGVCSQISKLICTPSEWKYRKNIITKWMIGICTTNLHDFNTGWIQLQLYVDRWLRWDKSGVCCVDHILYSRYTQIWLVENMFTASIMSRLSSIRYNIRTLYICVMSIEQNRALTWKPLWIQQVCRSRCTNSFFHFEFTQFSAKNSGKFTKPSINFDLVHSNASIWPIFPN